MNIPIVIRPKVDGVGNVLYRCATCGELMEPNKAVIADGKSYHVDHLPRNSDGR